MDKVFVTKYALTKGIYQEEGKYIEGMSLFEYKKPGLYTQYFHKGEFHLTLEQAKKDAEYRRKKKIEYLKKQIEKLEKLEF